MRAIFVTPQPPPPHLSSTDICYAHPGTSPRSSPTIHPHSSMHPRARERPQPSSPPPSSFPSELHRVAPPCMLVLARSRVAMMVACLSVVRRGPFEYESKARSTSSSCHHPISPPPPPFHLASVGGIHAMVGSSPLGDGQTASNTASDRPNRTRPLLHLDWPPLPHGNSSDGCAYLRQPRAHGSDGPRSCRSVSL